MGYIFERKGKIFRWTNGTCSVEFKNPSIQAHQNIVDLTDVKGIMYYYYTIDVYKKDYNNRNQKMLTSGSYDFPALPYFQEMLKQFLDNHMTQIDSYSHFQEDSYELTMGVFDNGKEHYTFTLGYTSTDDFYFKKSVSFEYLTKEEILELQKCVDAFIAYSMEKYSKQRNEYVDFHKTNKVVKENKLYVYEKDKNGTFIDRIYIPGETLEDISYLVEYGNTLCEEEIRDIVIESFDEQTMILYAEDGRELDLDKIMFMMEDMTDEKLQYDVPEIVEDFISVLTTDEIKRFQSENLDNLFFHYSEAIINRTWMCRDEHNFTERHPELLKIQDTGHHERVHEVVRMVIKEIKKQLGGA